MLMWMPGKSLRHADRPEVEGDVLEVDRGEPAGRVRTDGVERDVTEIEQAGIADDDVEPDRHHREREHHDHGSRRGDEVADHRRCPGGTPTMNG